MKIPDRIALSAGKAATPRVGLIRLDRLVRILEEAHRVYKKLPARVIQLFERREGRREQVTAYEQSVLANECGTPACALGHYAFHTPARWGWSRVHGLLNADDIEEDRYLVFNTPRLWRQAMHEFALTPEEVRELFESTGCGNAQTADEAAKYIRTFVAKKRKALGIKKPVKKAA